MTYLMDAGVARVVRAEQLSYKDKLKAAGVV